MTLTTLAWLAMAAYSLHILEEYNFDWRNWARNALHLPVEWTDFYITNAIVVALSIAQAELAPTLPLAPLSFAALMLTNAVFFHILPWVRMNGRFSPGLITAIVLFLPIGIESFHVALSSGDADWKTVTGAFIVGAVIMAYPIVMLKLKSRTYFLQTAQTQ